MFTYSTKEIAIYFIIFLIAGFLIPLLFYPVTDWILYFDAESLMSIIERNAVYFVLCEIWGFVIVSIGKVFLS